jgi:glycosyltransferase involved in cell wall biosynthesis
MLAPQPLFPSQLKVLQVVEASFAGVGRHVVDLCAALLARGHEVHLLYSPVRMERRFAIGIDALVGLRTQRLRLVRAPAPSDLTAALALRRYLYAHGPFDVVHGHSSKGGAVARLAAAGLPVARVYTPHALRTLDPGLSHGERFLYEAVEKLLGRHLTDAVVAVAEEDAREAARLGLQAARIHVVPNGLTLPALPARTTVRARLGLAEQDVCLMWVGRLIAQKDPHRFIRVFTALAGQVPEARAIMIGTGPLQAEVEASVHALGLAARFQLLRDEEAVLSMPAADIFVSTSRYEGLPYVLLEAQSVGLPVVGFATGGFSTVIEPGATGFILDQADEAGLAMALRRLIGDAELRRAMGGAAARRAQRFRLADMVDQIEALYRRLAAARRLRCRSARRAARATLS